MDAFFASVNRAVVKPESVASCVDMASSAGAGECGRARGDAAIGAGRRGGGRVNGVFGGDVWEGDGDEG